METTDLQVDPALRAFVADELLPGLDLTPEWFWATCAALQERFAGRDRRAAGAPRRAAGPDRRLAPRARRAGDDGRRYDAFLTEIGYLLPAGGAADPGQRVDPEIAEVPGPQLVVPATVPRYALNAANARWGSLFDALYGTDALPLDHELARGYDERRGAQVIAEADRLLDELFPLDGASTPTPPPTA